MKARGYGSGKRTNYTIYRFDMRNIVLSSVLVCFLAAIVFCMVKGGTDAEYIPSILMTWFGNGYMTAGLIIYSAFLFIPVFLNIMENLRWHISRSRI